MLLVHPGPWSAHSTISLDALSSAAGIRLRVVTVRSELLEPQGLSALRLALLAAAEGLPPLGAILLGATGAGDDEATAGGIQSIGALPPIGAASLEVQGLEHLVAEAVEAVLGRGVAGNMPLLSAGEWGPVFLRVSNF